MLEFTVTEL